jgi:hypothetical protein
MKTIGKLSVEILRLSLLKTSSALCQDVARRLRILIPSSPRHNFNRGGRAARGDGGTRRGRAPCVRYRQMCARHCLGPESASHRCGLSRRRAHASSGSDASVSVMEALDHRHGNDAAVSRGLGHPSVRRVLLKRKMTARASIIADVAGDVPSQRGLVHDEDVIQTLSTDRAVLLRISLCGADARAAHQTSVPLGLSTT